MKEAAAQFEGGPGLPPPLARLARLQAGTLLLGSALIVGSAMWALTPPQPLAAPQILLSAPPPAQQRDAHLPVDVDAFDAAIWVAVPAEIAPAAPKQPPPPPPLPRTTLELLAIECDASVRRALFYDSASQRILIAAPGDTIAGSTVHAIDPTGAMLRERGRDRFFALRDDAPLPIPKVLERRTEGAPQ